MDRQRFWAVLDVARTSGADNAGHARALVESLSRESPEDIESFARIQAELMNESYAWPLWGAAYVINGGCSDDGFDYFRGWLLIQGREVWERALADPDSLVRAVPEGGAVECEDVLYAAAQAFERVVGRPLGFATGASAGEPTGAKWSEDDLPALFPQLWARFADREARVSEDVEESLAVSSMRVGFSFLQQGRYEAACTLFGRARERAPRRLTVLLATNNIAWAQLLIDTPESRASAVSLAEEAVAGMEALEDPAAAAYRDAARGTFALALIATGRDAQGVRLVREILARPRPTKPVEATRQAILAIGLAHLGDRSGAIRAADEARAGDPRCILLPRAQQAIDARPRT